MDEVTGLLGVANWVQERRDDLHVSAQIDSIAAPNCFSAFSFHQTTVMNHGKYQLDGLAIFDPSSIQSKQVQKKNDKIVQVFDAFPLVLWVFPACFVYLFPIAECPQWPLRCFRTNSSHTHAHCCCSQNLDILSSDFPFPFPIYKGTSFKSVENNTY